MFRRSVYLVAAVALVAACKGKQTTTDQENVPVAPGVDSSSMSGTDMGKNTPLAGAGEGSDSGKIEGLVTVNFDLDKANLTSESKRKIKGNVEWLKANPNVKMQIEGHCDARGSIEYNVALGERRAGSVRAYMVSLGIPAARLSTISYGKERPLVDGDDETAYAQNRRANFVPLQ